MFLFRWLLTAALASFLSGPYRKIESTLGRRKTGTRYHVDRQLRTRCLACYRKEERGEGLRTVFKIKDRAPEGRKRKKAEKENVEEVK